MGYVRLASTKASPACFWYSESRSCRTVVSILPARPVGSRHWNAQIPNKIEVKPKVSTTEVKTKIEDALRRSAEVDARRITVSAQDGAVTLYGNVRSWFEKQAAERAAWAAPGVSRVIDNIAVVP